LRPSAGVMLGMILLAVAGYFLFTRTPFGFMVAALLAVLVALAARAARRPMRLIVNAQGVAWMHPERGAGSINFRDVGALILREDWGGAQLAVYLVPKTHSQSYAGRLQPTPSFVLTGRDLTGAPVEGEAGLKEFTASVLPRLPVDVTLDRGTRQRLAAWGIVAPAPPGGRDALH